MNSSNACPCGTGQIYDTCCGPYLRRQAQPARAEALMRSRYSAYVMGNEEYLLATWHDSKRPAQMNLGETPPIQWLGLKVINVIENQIDNTATVEFMARYKVKGKAYQLHEVSRFVRENGAWFYVDGDIQE